MTQYLVNGHLKTWKGATSNVYSTIKTRDSSGELVSTLLGSIPDMEDTTSLRGLRGCGNGISKGSRLMAYNEGRRSFKAYGNFC